MEDSLNSADEISVSRKRKHSASARSPSKSQSTDKGKAIAVATETEEKEKGECGICLISEGVNTRGKLDCCNHYYCFTCIREWAKVETRCPACRQRFKCISRVSLGSKDRTFRVPTRDQVYVPEDDENGESDRPEDPYADVYCSECAHNVDDHLLLLCDMCDSATHTYCVGLGRTVPFGEWYCHSCKELRDNNSVEGEDDLNGTLSEEDLIRYCISSTIDPPTSISNANTAQLSAACNSSSLLPSEAGKIQSRSNRGRDPQRLSNIAMKTLQGSESSVPNPRDQGSLSSANFMGGPETVSHRRMLQERIQLMRENWKRFQNGELQFSSVQMDPMLRNKKKLNIQDDIEKAWAKMERAKSISCNDSRYSSFHKGKSFHQSSSPFMPERANDHGQSRKSDLMQLNKRKHNMQDDIDKAWTMMEVAKSIGHNNGSSLLTKDKSNSQVLSSSKPHGKSSRNEDNICSGRDLNTTHQIGETSGSQHDNLKALSCGSTRLGNTGYTAVTKSSSISQRAGNQANQMQPVEQSLQEKENSGSLSRISVGGQSSCNVHLLKQTSGIASCQSCPESRQVASTSQVSVCSTSQHSESSSNAKNKVLPMVKAKLKSIHSCKRLGADKFKEIAKVSTHTVLTACGYEDFKKGITNLEPVFCSHLFQEKSPPSLMQNCCNDCFSTFVKNVVQRVAKDLT